ncbi:MAG: helix-turn-helix domain-containing protein [Sphingomicrobium sp.]
MDESKVEQNATFKGFELELHRHSGARALRIVHPEAQIIDEHRHDWPYIGLFTAGRYRERYDGGEAEMAGPCAVFHPAGRPHADLVGDEGLETLTVEFDFDWLRHHGFEGHFDRSRLWQGGAIAAAARRLAQTLGNARSSEAEIGRATSAFLQFAMTTEDRAAPQWVDEARRIVRAETTSTIELARRLSLHPAWLARAYRLAAGEGLHETSRRVRVERACRLIRLSGVALAEAAVAAGFCDQSHMSRCFRAVLGRTPLQVRRELSWSEPGFG